MNLRFLAALIGLPLASAAQQKIKLEDVASHAGDSVTVCATVAACRYLNRADGGPTYFYLGAPYPRQSLTLVVWKKDRTFFKTPPELTYADQDVCVAGRIEIVAQKPQIVLTNEKQIRVVDEDDD
ncbi:MAG: hypothetical protein JWP27_653 [Flaviaesturariibacter sp.]|nr:hypothetical protein [Flaviaesturariibacter sp.]